MIPSLDLLFFLFLDEDIKKFKLSFDEKKENIEKDKMTFPIPDIVFKHGKDKATVHISLYDEVGNSENYKFHVYYGKNKAHIQTDSLSKNVFELILMNLDNVKITEFGKEFTEFDDLGNRDRKRLTLINYRSRCLKINGKSFDLPNIISENILNNEVPLNQISILDLEKKIIYYSTNKRQNRI